MARSVKSWLVRRGGGKFLGCDGDGTGVKAQHSSMESSAGSTARAGSAIPPPPSHDLSRSAIPPPPSHDLPCSAIPPPPSHDLSRSAIPPPPPLHGYPSGTEE